MDDRLRPADPDPSTGQGGVTLESAERAQDQAHEGHGTRHPATMNRQSDLNALSARSKGQRLARRAWRLFLRDFEISGLVASWVVVLSLPVIIWKWADDLNGGCDGLDVLECLSKRPVCTLRFSAAQWKPACQSTQPSAYLALYGLLILQFVLSVYKDLGSTVKLTLQGVFGTVIAWANISLLNVVSCFKGGAYAHHFVPPGQQVANSKWLPLCSDGSQRLAGENASCYLNIWWSQLSLSGCMVLAGVWLNFLFFVVLCLALGFDTNTRIFALSTHIYFMMSFLDPTTDGGFHTSMSIAFHYCWMVLVASFMAVMCFLLPWRRFTALETAEALETEAADSVEMVVGCLCCTTGEVTRQKVVSVAEEAKASLEDLERALGASWFEDFGLGARATRRRRLRALSDCLRACIRHVLGVTRVAAVLSPGDQCLLEEHVGPLQRACGAARGILRQRRSVLASGARLSTDFEDCMREVPQAFASMQAELSPEASAFLFLVSGVATDVVEAVEHLGDVRQQLVRQPLGARARRVFHTVATRFGTSLVDRSATHPRFVVRNTLSIAGAFLIGWNGIWNVMPAYSYCPASTIAVITYTYTGASAPITIRRVAGVVLGRVLGIILMLSSAARTWYYALMFGVSMWVVVAFMFFLYLHGDDGLSQVSCLTAAYAAAGMIPPHGRFRDVSATTMGEVLPGLCATIIQTVMGVGIVTIVDLLFGSPATRQARQRLQRTLHRAKQHIARALSEASDPQSASQLQEDLDAVRDLLPYAAAEPAYWRQPFQTDLYNTLHLHLQSMSSHLAVAEWAVKRFGQPAPRPVASQDCLGPAFRSALEHVRRELVAMFNAMQDFANGMINESVRMDTEDLMEMRRQLQSNLYFARAAQYIALRTPALGSRVVRERGTDVKVQGFRQLARRFVDQVVSESLQDSGVITGAPIAAEGEAACSPLAVDQHLQQLRSVAAQAIEPQRASLPHQDNLCCVELVILVVRLVRGDIQKMQLALMEY